MELHEFNWEGDGNNRSLDLRIEANEDGSLGISNLRDSSQSVTCPSPDEAANAFAGLFQNPTR